MTLFEKNLKVLERTSPKFYKRICVINGSSTQNIEVFSARSSHPTVQVKHKGSRTLLHSSYDPVAEASRFVSTFNITDETKVVVVFGVGFAYHVTEIMRRLPSHACLILLEKDEFILKKAMEVVDFSFLNDSRVSLFCGDFDFDSVKMVVYPLFFPKIPEAKDIVIVSHLASMQLYPEYYHDLREKLKDAISQFAVVVSTQVFVSPKWSVSVLKNVDEVIKNPSVTSLFGKNKGKPAIVVSAGPSLDKNIDLLAEVQNKALIIAVGTSLKPLLKRGIKPHLVVAIDGDKKHYEHFRDITVPDDVAFVCDAMIYPRILDEIPGKKFLCDTCDTAIKKWLYSYFDRSCSIDSGFSVATTAYSLAKKMGSSPVIFIGQDLSYADDGHTHAGWTTFQNQVIESNSEFNVKVRGNTQQEVYTSHVFLSTLRWFERAIRQDNTLCVNATEGGARIEGTEVMSLKEAMQTYCTEELSFDYLRSAAKADIPSREIFDDFFDSTRKAVENVSAMRSMSKDGAKAASTLLDDLMDGLDVNGHEFQRKAQKVQTLVDELRANDGAMFVDPWMQEIYLFLHKTQDGIKELEEHSVTVQEMNRAGVFFEGLYKATSEVLPLLEEAQKKAKAVYNDFYGRKAEKKMRVVVFDAGEDSSAARYMLDDYSYALQQMGHDVARVKMAGTGHFKESNVKQILAHRPDMIFTAQNHVLHPLLLDAVKMPVLNFCKDSFSLGNDVAALARANHYLFFTKKSDVLEYRDEGFYNVYLIPPSGNRERFFYKKEISNVEHYACDVSFAAFSCADSFKTFDELKHEAKDVLEEVVVAQSNALYLTLGQVIRRRGLALLSEKGEEFMPKKEFRFLTQKASALHRIEFLKMIHGDIHFKLFGDEGWKEIFPESPYCGPVDYGMELVNVYNASKINLGLCSYGVTAIYSKVLDIALCKAFGLFEYTPGIEQYFTNGHDIVWFETPEEMVKLIEFYLARPEDRERIAENAYRNVIQNHTVVQRMEKMLDIVLREM